MKRDLRVPCYKSKEMRITGGVPVVYVFNISIVSRQERTFCNIICQE